MDDEEIVRGDAAIFFIFAFIFYLFYMLTPFYFVKKYDNKLIEIKEVPFVQIFFNILNCCFYIIIAIKGTGTLQNLLTNIIGLCASFSVLIYLWLILKKDKGIDLFYLFLIINAIFQISYFVYRVENLTNFTSDMAIIINILMYLSINQNDIYAIKEKRADLIPVLSSTFGLLTSFCWYFFGYLAEDRTTWISNIISIVCNAIPTIEYFILLFLFGAGGKKSSENNYSTEKRINNKKKDETEQ